MKQQKRAQREDTSTYYVWIGGSCDYGHKERAGGAAVVIEHNGSIISRDVISDHNSVAVKIVQYHKSPLLIETHDRATEAMAKTRKEFHQKNNRLSVSSEIVASVSMPPCAQKGEVSANALSGLPSSQYRWRIPK